MRLARKVKGKDKLKNSFEGWKLENIYFSSSDNHDNSYTVWLCQKEDNK